MACQIKKSVLDLCNCKKLGIYLQFLENIAYLGIGKGPVFGLGYGLGKQINV